ncbi:MAG: DUF3102 domain-containing protein [Oscillospiraceae bacterium]|nr:DUF3102 domain-containing protein [Oscillospiraceae bacterium]
MNEIITVRDIDTITTEIKTIENQVAKMAIHGCIEIGRRLTEAKELVGHGGWGKYLEEKVCYSQQWATNLMNLYKEYGQQQESLFESFANSKSFGNIDVTKHILLLSVPSEERAEFAEVNDAEHSTVRELKEAIRDRDANLQAANEQAARAEKAEAEVEKLNAAVLEQADMLDAKDVELSQLEDKIVELRRQAEAAEGKQTEAAGKVDKLKAQLAKAKDAEKTVRAELEKAKANPEIPESLMEQMRSEVAAEAAAKATADLQKQLAAAQADAAEAEKRRLDAEAKIVAAQKQVQLSNPDMVLVSTYLQGVQEQFNKMLGALKKVALADPEAGAKLKENVKAKLIENLRKAIDAV